MSRLLNNANKALSLNKKTVLNLLIAPTCMLGLAGTSNVEAGAFLFAGASAIDRITHPPGYTGTGGSLSVNVCIVPGSPNATSMERSVQNAIAYWNKLQPTTSNLRNHLPGGTNHAGMESIFVHELGHCIGLAHPNFSTESGKFGDERNYTKSTQGANTTFDINPGADGIIGSADDARGDDKNLHWFRINNNNPFSIGSIIDTSTYARNTNQLPGGSLFAANGDRKVSNLYRAPHSEAIMQQGAFFGEIQRTLSHDDVATLKLAMSGVDGTTNTSDDYTVNLTYGGISTSNCNINVSFNDNETGFAVCKTTGTVLGNNHARIDTANVFLNTGFNWHFNNAPQCSQRTDLVANEWRMISMPCQLGISTPSTVEAVFGDDLTPADYGVHWVLYEYLPTIGYKKLALSDSLKEGAGYWMTADHNASIDVEGEYNSNIDYPLGENTWNLAGTPFRFGTVWADVRVVDTNGTVLSLSQADPLLANGRRACSPPFDNGCVVASTGFHWNGSTGRYDTLSLNAGSLSPFDAAWVYSKKAGTALRVPMYDDERTNP